MKNKYIKFKNVSDQIQLFFTEIIIFRNLSNLCTSTVNLSNKEIMHPLQKGSGKTGYALLLRKSVL